ncbi:hypothetical protein [Maribacter polysaccharolyticus]|uniref:hypothetical protein n=1 Tax=Maribacter polysaccharolyticus TaxID=3020831 RepID=UPI00237EED74|nr:hypothetical protein [Maribacter polysaccharolyticus]MDE3740203.1 hypothetical protein [Maribacter polysaccharolyticus]
MKNLIKTGLVVIVLFTTLFVNANPTKEVLDDNPKTRLTLSNVKQGNKLSVKDVYGAVLYRETIRNSGNYIKTFDLTSLPDGDYFFELVDDLKIKTIPFTVQATAVSLKKDHETIVLRPFVKSKENLVYVSSPSTVARSLKINIYYDDNGYKLINSETLENTKDICRIYELNKIEKGNYKVVTEMEGRTFTDYIEL